jgi:hypothetical protein
MQLTSKTKSILTDTYTITSFFAPNTRWISSQTAFVTSIVVALPPRSFVITPASQTLSTISSKASPALSSPSHFNISTAVQNVATGLAKKILDSKQLDGELYVPIPIPVISKADPWIGSNIEGFSRVGSRLLVGAIPIEPASAAARSERISAC